jgi:hypothetical protein
MSFISVAVEIFGEGLAANIAAGAMMGGSVTIGSNVLRGRNPFDNIGQGILMGGFTAGITPFVQSGIGEFVTGGISNAAATGITAGALGYARSGNINDALTSGLSAYGLSSLGGNLESAGGQQLANQDTIANAERMGAAADQAPPIDTNPYSDLEAMTPAGKAQFIEDFQAQNAQNIDEAANAAPKTTAKNITDRMRNQGMSEEAIRAKFAEAGKSAVASNPMSFLKANAKNLMYAAAPLLADQAVQSNMPQTATPRPGMIRPYSYDPYSGTYTAYDPYKAADGGLMGYGESTNAPITRRNIDSMQNTNGMFNYAQDGGPALRMAHGGLAALAFADGGGVDMFSPYVDLLAHPEKSGFIPGAERDAYMKDIQDKQDELNQRIIARQTSGGGTAQPINWQQTPSYFNAAITQPFAPASKTPAQSGFVAGGGETSLADYNRAVAIQTAKTNAENAAQDAYQIPPDSPFYAASKVATGDRLNNLKNSAYEFDLQQKNRAAIAAANPGGDGFTVSGPNNEGYNYGASKFGVTSKDWLPNVKTTTDVPRADTNNAPAANTSGSQASDALRSQATQQLLKDTGAYAVVGAPFAGSDGLAYNGPPPSKDVVDQAWAKYYATLGGSGAPTANTNNVPAANTNTPSAAQQYKDQHLVDPTTGHLLNPTLDAATLQQTRDGINTEAEMRQAYNSYWDTVKPGDILDFAGGTLTMNKDGSSTHTYTDASGKQQSYTFNRSTDFATVANSDPNIASEWKGMFNYTAPKNTGSPTITTPGPTGPVLTPGTGGPGRVTQVPTGWTPPVAPPSKVPTSFEDFNTKYNTLTGGSKQAYDYLTGKTEYSPTPYTKTGEIMKPYSESVLGIPGDISKKKYLFQDGKYVKNPAFRPPKPVGTPVEGKEWAWDGTKWTQMAPDDLTNHDVEPIQPAGEGLIWYWQDNKWVKIPAPIKDPNKTNDKANGGLMALAGGGMAERYNLGGYSDGGRLLRGPGDGVSDSIPASIGNRQPARLADGEFVVPARIVSELGNGSTEAGARKLYAMMDRVQRARRHSIGKGNVAKNSRADKYLPA